MKRTSTTPPSPPPEQRFHRLPEDPSEWRLDPVARGFGHGHLYLWAEDGTLMGTASQSAMIRPWRGVG
jgi:acyl-CoA thioesterase